MAYTVDLPDGRSVEFPDEVPREQAAAIIQKQFPPTGNTGLMATAKNMVNSTINQYRTAAGAVTGDANEAAAAGAKRAQEIEAANASGIDSKKLGALWDKGDYLGLAKEAAGQAPAAITHMAPMLGEIAAGSRLGAMAGTAVAPGVGTVVGGIAGGALSQVPRLFGAKLEEKAAEQQAEGKAVDVQRLPALGSAAFDALLNVGALEVGIPGLANKLAGKTAAELTQGQLDAAVKLAQKGMARAAAEGTVKMAATMPAVVTAQTANSRAYLGKDLTGPDAMQAYKESLLGTLPGLPLGAYGGVKHRSAAIEGVARNAANQRVVDAAFDGVAEQQAAAQQALDKQKPEYLDALQKRYQDLMAQRAQEKAALGPPPSKEAQVADPAAYLAWQEKSKAHAAGLKDPDTAALIREVADRKADIDALAKTREEAQADAAAAAKHAEAAKGVPETTGAVAPEDSGETVPTPAITDTFGQAQALHQDAVKRAGEAARAGDFDAAQKAQDEATHHAEVMNTLKRLQTQETPPEPTPPPAPIPRDPLTDELTKRLQQLQGGTTKKGNPIDGLYVKAVRLGDNEGAAAHLAEMRQIQQKLATRQTTLDEMNSRGEDLNKQQSAPDAGTDMSGYTEGLRNIEDAGQELRVDHDFKQMQANRMNTGKTEQVSLFPAEPSKTSIYQQSRDTLTQAFRDARKSGDRNAMAKAVEDIRLYDAAQQMNGPKKQLAHRVSPVTGNAVESNFTPKAATPESVKAQMDALPAPTTPRRDLASMTGTKPNGEEAQAVAQRLGRNVDGKANAPAVDAQTESLLQRLRDNFAAFTADPARIEMAAEWLHGLRTRRATRPVADEMHADVGRSRDIAAELDRLEQGKRSETENGHTAVQGDLLDGVPSKAQTTTNKNGISGEIAGEEPPTRGTVFKTPEEFAKFMASDALHKMRSSVGPVRQTLARAVARIEALKKQLAALGAEAKKLTDRQNLLQRGKDTRTAETTAQYEAAMKRLEQVRANVEAELAPTHANILRVREALQDSARRSAEISATIDANIAKFMSKVDPEELAQIHTVTQAKDALYQAALKDVTKANWDAMRDAQKTVTEALQKLLGMQDGVYTDHRIKQFLRADLEAQLLMQHEFDHAARLRDDMQGLQEMADQFRTLYEGLHKGEVSKAEAGVDAAKRAAELAATKNEPKLAAVAEKQRANANEAAGVGEQIKAEEASVGRTPEQRARDAAPPPEPIDPKLQAAMDKIAAERAAMQPFTITPTHIAVQKDSIAKAREKAGQEPLSATELTKQATATLEQRAKDFGNEPYTQDQLRRLGEEELANQTRREHQTHLEALQHPVDAKGNPLPREQVNNEQYRAVRDGEKMSTERAERKAALRTKADDEALPQTTRNKAQRLWRKMEREDKTRETSAEAQKQIDKLANETIPHLVEQEREADVKNPDKEQKTLLATRRKELSKARQELTKLAKLVQRGKRTDVTEDRNTESIPELIAIDKAYPSAETAEALRKARETAAEQRAINDEGIARLEQLHDTEIPALKRAYAAKPSIEARDALQAAIREARELTAQAHQRAPMERPERIAGNTLTGDLTTTGERVVPQGVPISQGRAAKGKGTKVGKKEQQAANAIADEIGVTTPRKTEDKAGVAKAEAETKAAETARRLADKEAEIEMLQKQLPRAEESAEKAESRVGISPEARDALRNRPDALRKLIAEKESERDALKAQQVEANKPVEPAPEPIKEPQANREDAEAALADHELESYDGIPDPKTGNYDDFAGEFEGHAFRTTEGGGHGMHVADVRTAVENTIKGWTNVPEIRYVQSEGELPLRLQGYIKKTANEGNVPAVRDGITGKVWMVGDNIKDARDAVLSVVHEVAGHHGLREMLGNTYNDVMNRMYNGNEAVRTAADAKMKANDTMHKELAVEEVMADMAEKNPKSNALKQVFYAVKGWLFKKFGFKGVSDGEVAQIVANARRYVETDTGPQTGGGGDRRTPALRKKDYTTETAKFGRDLSQNRSVVQDVKAAGWKKILMAAEQKIVDSRAALRYTAKIGSTHTGTQVMGDILTADRAMQNAMAVFTKGGFKLVKDSKGLTVMKAAGKTNAKEVVQRIGELPGAGTAEEKMDLFQGYMTALRARDVGWHTLDYDNPAEMQRRGEAAIKEVQSDPALLAAMNKAQDTYHEYNKELVQFLKDTNAVPDDVADKMMQDRNYIPMFRNKGDSLEMVMQNGKSMSVGDVRTLPFLHALNGGNAKLMPFEESMFRNTTMLTNLGVQNMTARHIAYHLQGIGATAKTMQIKRGDGGAARGGITIRFRDKPQNAQDDGERHVVIDTKGTAAEHIPNDLLAQAVAGSYSSTPALLNMGKYASDILRSGVTRMPTYLVSQMWKDPVNAAIMGNLKADPFTAVVKSMNNMREHLTGKSSEALDMEAMGILHSNIFNGTPDDVRKMLMHLGGSNQGWYRKAMSKLDNVAMGADSATRIQGYRDVIKAGGSELEAAIHAQEMQNFSKHGSSQSMQVLSRLIPFFNAQVQGLNVLLKSATGKMPANELLDTKNKFFKRALGMTALSLAYAASLDDDPEWRKLSLRSQMANIKMGDWQLPAPFETGMLLYSLPVAFIHALKQNFNENDWNDVSAVIKNQLPGNGSIMPQFAKGYVDVTRNYNSYFGSPIESRRMDKLATTEKFAANTPEMMKEFSRQLVDAGVNLSPVQLDYLSNAYLGQLPHMVGMLTNHLFETKSATHDSGEAPTGTAKDNPLLARFVRNPKESRNVNDAYTRVDHAMLTDATIKSMKQDGRAAQAEAYRKEQLAQYGTPQQARAFQNQMGFMKRQEDAIKLDKSLDGPGKQKKIEELYKRRDAVAANYLKIVDAKQAA